MIVSAEDALNLLTTSVLPLLWNVVVPCWVFNLQPWVFKVFLLATEPFGWRLSEWGLQILPRTALVSFLLDSGNSWLFNEKLWVAFGLRTAPNGFVARGQAESEPATSSVRISGHIQGSKSMLLQQRRNKAPNIYFCARTQLWLKAEILGVDWSYQGDQAYSQLKHLFPSPEPSSAASYIWLLMVGQKWVLLLHVLQAQIFFNYRFKSPV